MIEITSENKRFYTSQIIFKVANFTAYLASDNEGNEFELRMLVNPSNETRDFLTAQKTTLLELNHPNVRRIHDIFFKADTLYILMDEPGDSDLECLLLNQQSINDRMISEFMSAVLSAFLVLTMKGFIFAPFTLKDIQVSQGHMKYDPLGINHRKIYDSPEGVPLAQYLAPELLSKLDMGGNSVSMRVITSQEMGRRQEVRKASFWSFGVSLLVVSTRDAPLGKLTTPAIIGAPVRIDLDAPAFKNKLNFDLKNLLSKILDPNPATRLTNLSEIESHAFFSKALKLDLKSKDVKYLSDGPGKPAPPKPNGRLMPSDVANSNGDFQPKGFQMGDMASGQFSNFNSAFDSFRSSDMYSHSHTYNEDDNKSVYNYFLESELPQEFINYVYEKNIIIFVVDSAKKVKQMDGLKSLEPLQELIHRTEIFIVKKSYIQNYTIQLAMSNGVNLFGIDNFETLSESKHYQNLMRFYEDFNAYVKQTYYKLKYEYDNRYSDKEHSDLISNIDKLIMANIDANLQKFLGVFKDFYVKNVKKIPEAERVAFLQSMIYIHFNKGIYQQFDIQKFPRTQDWIRFCEQLNAKSVPELEVVLFGAKK